MWKYLKDYVMGKLLNKWITSTNNLNTSTSDAFLHYQNIELNTKSFNDTILNTLNYSLNNGIIEELNVDINWKEIFRYWTEIRTKYHIETEVEDDDDENIIENAENSLIKIKGLVLNLTSSNTPKNYCPSDEEPVIDSTDVDLMKDFLNHIIGQFKLEIKDIKIIILNKEDLIITVPNVIILPESNGQRRILILEDITLTSPKGRILKGTEILIMRTIEGEVIKIKIPGIEIESNDLNSLMELVEIFKNDNDNIPKVDNPTNSNTSITIDTLKLSIGPLYLVLHDIWIEAGTGQFILGHFNLKLKDYSIIMSPIQTHVITGDCNRVMFEEEIVIKFRDMNQIEDIKKLLSFEKTGNNNNFTNNTKYQMRSVLLIMNGINIRIDDITLVESLISINSINVSYRSSKLSISNIKYKMVSNTRASNNISPFSELKKFIENDEIISVEDETILYENYKGLINNLDIERVIGTFELEELEDLKGNMASSNTNNSILLIMGTIDKMHIDLNLSNAVVYQIQLCSLQFLKAEEFFDLRTRLDYFKRNSQILTHSTDLIAVKTDDITVAFIENMNLLIPYNLNDSLTNDIMILRSLFASKTNSATSNNFQISLKNSKIKLEAPVDLKEPVESELFIKEINCKSDVLYVDEVILRVNNQTILNSGLLKINYDSKSIEIMNHCSNIYLDPTSYQNLIKFVRFWSDIYSPVIEEIQPEAVFHDESSFDTTEHDDENLSSGISGTLMQFENGQGNEDFELELELSVEEAVSSDSDTENDCGDENDCVDPVCTTYNSEALQELLKDIDNDFFINKQKEIIDDYFLKMTNFGIKINLILSESSKEDLIVSLTGIDGTISSDKINFKVKEGTIHKNIKTILYRWPRGPDVTCKYPIEEGNFVSVKAEKLGIKNDAGIDEYNLIISICPLRLFLDQNSLNDITAFFKITEKANNQSNDKLKSFIFFNKVNISPLALKIDYNPNSTSSSAPIPLQGAEMVLPRVELRGVKGFEGLGPALFSTWIPELKGKKLTGVLTTGLVPVRTIVNLGGGVAELILLPWQLGPEQSAAQTVAQIRKNGKKIGLETLKLTASLASRTSKLLNTHQPSTTSYPADFQSGVQQAAQLIIALPTRLGQSNKGALRAVPLIVLDSAATATGALAKTLQGIQAEFDREIDYERKIKRK